ncbi:uncharacterized protein [Cardiocondyla obscurior]|uniref:uncharacterized protein isoform X1 n=1 Tax=Cardiocondyla obscurior TaxID=286306 RepID=UPI00396578F0
MAADEDQASDNKQQQGDQIIVSCARVEVVNAYVTQHSGYSERRRRFRMDIIHRRSNPWISCRINSAAAHRIGTDGFPPLTPRLTLRLTPRLTLNPLLSSSG